MCSEHREPSAIYFHYIRQQAEKNKIRETRREWISRATGKKLSNFGMSCPLNASCRLCLGQEKLHLNTPRWPTANRFVRFVPAWPENISRIPSGGGRMFPLLKKRRLLTANTLKTQFIFIPLSPISPLLIENVSEKWHWPRGGGQQLGERC